MAESSTIDKIGKSEQEKADIVFPAGQRVYPATATGPRGVIENEIAANRASEIIRTKTKFDDKVVTAWRAVDTTPVTNERTGELSRRPLLAGTLFYAKIGDVKTDNSAQRHQDETSVSEKSPWWDDQ